VKRILIKISAKEKAANAATVEEFGSLELSRQAVCAHRGSSRNPPQEVETWYDNEPQPRTSKASQTTTSFEWAPVDHRLWLSQGNLPEIRGGFMSVAVLFRLPPCPRNFCFRS